MTGATNYYIKAEVDANFLSATTSFYTQAQTTALFVTTGTTQTISGDKTFSNLTINSGFTVNKTLITANSLPFDSTNGTVVSVTSVTHGLTDGETIVVDGSTNTNVLNNGSYLITLIDADTFSVLTALNTTGSGTLNYARPASSYITGDPQAGVASFDTSLNIKDLTINQNYAKGGVLMYAPNSIKAGQGDAFRYYWGPSGNFDPGDIVRTADYVGYVSISGTFSENETIRGSLSGSTGKVLIVDGYQTSVLILDRANGDFFSGETISGLTSGRVPCGKFSTSHSRRL